MAENTTNYQCPACTGPLRFDSASGKLCCDYCGSTYDVAQVEALYGEKQARADKAAEAAEKAASSGSVWGEMETGNLSSRTCTSCGAELVCGPETAATTCPYCGNPTVLGGQLSGKLKPADFVRVPVDGSSKMPDAHMDAIEPFDYSDLKPFSTAYLPGFLADRYDEDDKKCAARVLTRMKNSTAAALHDTLGGYTGVQTLSEQIDSRTLEPHYVLLPVWMLHTRWKEQDFLFAMNGQTGKLIGDLPVDKGRVAAWFAGISIPLMILTALIMLL